MNQAVIKRRGLRLLSIMSLLVILATLSVTTSPATVQAQSSIPYRFFMWYDGNSNGIMDTAGYDVCVRDNREMVYYGWQMSDPVYSVFTVTSGDYTMTTESHINQCAINSMSSSVYLAPNYEYHLGEPDTNAITVINTPASCPSCTIYAGIKLPFIP